MNNAKAMKVLTCFWCYRGWRQRIWSRTAATSRHRLSRRCCISYAVTCWPRTLSWVFSWWILLKAENWDWIIKANDFRPNQLLKRVNVIVLRPLLGKKQIKQSRVITDNNSTVFYYSLVNLNVFQKAWAWTL